MKTLRIVLSAFVLALVCGGCCMRKAGFQPTPMMEVQKEGRVAYVYPLFVVRF